MLLREIVSWWICLSLFSPLYLHPCDTRISEPPVKRHRYSSLEHAGSRSIVFYYLSGSLTWRFVNRACSNQKLTPARPIAFTSLIDEPQESVHTVVIDCSGFTFIDSVGLHVLPAVSRFKFLAIPLKLFYCQTFFETWRNEHSSYEHYKNAIKIWGHRACWRVSRLLKWGIFARCALKVWITFIQN